MAKSKKTTSNKANKPNKGAQKQRKAMSVPRAVALDPAAEDLRRLIQDPCNAKLVPTIWPGAHGSFVSRFESDWLDFVGAGETAGALFYIPGLNAVYCSAPGAVLGNDLAPFQFGGVTTTRAPGYNFITSSAGSVRAVAACIQVSFPGTELDRSGIVSGGVVQAGSLTPNVAPGESGSGGGGVNTTVSAIRQLCQHTERTPQEMMEITWQPGPGDQIPCQLGAALPKSEFLASGATKNALVVSVAGLKSAVGIRFRIVTVLEWTPRTAEGLVATVETPRSTNSLNDILMALPRNAGTNWFINAYKKRAPYIQAAGAVISYGAKQLGKAMLAL